MNDDKVTVRDLRWALFEVREQDGPVFIEMDGKIREVRFLEVNEHDGKTIITIS